jgi:hypothetical protein
MKFEKSKFIIYFLFFSQILTSSINKSLHNIPTSTEDLRVQLFMTKQAIKNLKSHIENIKQSQKIDPKFKQVENKFEALEPEQKKPHHKLNELISTEIENEMKLDKEVHDYYNHNPKNDTLLHLKSRLKENGIRDFEEMIDMLDNHPEEISHGTQNEFLKTNEKLNSLYLEKNYGNNFPNSNKKLKFKQLENLKKNSSINKNKNGPININDILKHFN